MSGCDLLDELMDFTKPYERVYISPGIVREYHNYVITCKKNGTKLPTFEEYQILKKNVKEVQVINK